MITLEEMLWLCGLEKYVQCIVEWPESPRRILIFYHHVLRHTCWTFLLFSNSWVCCEIIEVCFIKSEIFNNCTNVLKTNRISVETSDIYQWKENLSHFHANLHLVIIFYTHYLFKTKKVKEKKLLCSVSNNIFKMNK